MTREAERRRQQALVQRLMVPGAQALPDGLRPHRLPRGLAAYEANAAGAAERALAGTYPTVQAMLGTEPFGRLAQALWAAHPPLRGDLSTWGDDLPGFLAANPSLAEWPYLADCARLDAAVARCAGASDAAPDPATLARLGEADADRLYLDRAPGVSVLGSAFPIVTLWHAHRAGGLPDHLPLARAALAEGRSEHALVWRAGWRPEVSLADGPAVQFTAALLAGVSLGEALHGAGPAFVFEPWLVSAVRDGWLLQVRIAP